MTSSASSGRARASSGTPHVVVFDMDGTLLDSRAAALRALREAARAFTGQEPPGVEEMLRLMTASPEERFRSLLPSAREGEWETLRELTREFERRYMPEMGRPFPEARPALSALRQSGIRIALVSECSPAYLALGRRVMGADALLDHWACTGADDKSKASLAAEAIELLGGGRAAVVGDRGRDIAAAREIGAYAIKVTWGWPDWDHDEPDAVVDNFAELLGAICGGAAGRSA